MHALQDRRPSGDRSRSGRVDAHEPSLGEALEGRIRTPGKSQHALRDRAGRHVRAPARRVARGPQGNRLSRLRRGRSLRGRAQGRDAPHHGRDRAQASRRPSPLSDGRGHARRPRGGRLERDRHVRLRDADAQCAKRLALHALRRREDQEQPLQERSASA